MVQVSFNTDGGSRQVSEYFFGGNFLFDRDDIGVDGTFDQKVDALNVGYIRYPGGTITERYFKLADPDRETAPETRKGVLTPLSDFVEYVSSEGRDYALVLPTLDYMRSIRSGDMTLAEAEAELERFLIELKRGDYGPLPAKTIEIGNEYYSEMSFGGVALAEAYGELARAFAETVRDVFGEDVRIAVQAGRDPDANDAILDHFRDGGAVVDDVIVHAYPWTIDGVVFHHEVRLGHAQDWIDAGVAEGVFLSEWNVSNQYRDADGDVLGPDQIERGMAQSVALLELAYGYHLAGVEQAAVWPLQQNTPGDLGGDEGETGDHRKLSDSGLTLVGEAFRLMSESVVGMRAIEVDNIDIDGAAEADRYRDEIYLQAYADVEQVVVFASSWNLDASQVGTELSFTLPGHFVSATVTTLDTASNDPFNPNGAPILAERTISPLASSADVTLTFDASYQIHRVVYERLTGEYVVGTAAAEARKGGDDSDRILGRNGDDTLSGGAGSDTLLGQGSDDDIRGGRGDDLSIGGRGEDMLIGGQGADDLRGGKGDDLIRGGGGRDTLKGGGGSDELRGGGGRDELFGGSGSDELRGGAGADRLVAGGGDDLLFGGGGADRFEFSATNSTHRVADYAEGVDLLVFDGIDAADVSLTTRGGDAIVEAGGLTVIVEDAAQLELGDLLFV